jgi:hypothetical protein
MNFIADGSSSSLMGSRADLTTPQQAASPRK